MTASSGASAPVISTPQGGGALKGIGEAFTPDLFTGTGNFTVPLALPNGRSGFQPKLSLGYSTGNGNGPFGLGWALSVPNVSRKTSKGVPRYERSDIFVLSGSEDLVPTRNDPATRSQYYQPRTEGLFARIRHVTGTSADYWEVATKDGLVSTYGDADPARSSESVISNPANRGDPLKFFSWKLSETRDPFNNRILYDYRRDDPPATAARQWDQNYLKLIRYVDFENGGVTSYLISVEFFYDDEALTHAVDPPVSNRPDEFSEYRSSFEIRTRRRCSLILIRTHPVGLPAIPVRAYRLIYLDERTDVANLKGQLPANGASLLSRIEAIGYDDAGNSSSELPPLDFMYTKFDPAKRLFTAVPGGPESVPSLSDPDVELVDLHGGGLPDVVQVAGGVRYWRNFGEGKFGPGLTMSEAPMGVNLSDTGVQLLDMNGDGRADLQVNGRGAAAAFTLEFGPKWKGRPSLGRVSPTFDLRDPEVRFFDLDGDGVTDALRTGLQLECFFQDQHKGWSTVRTVARRGFDEFPDVSFSDPRVRIADMSGDGLQDIVFIHSGNVVYWPNLGHGNWGKAVVMDNAPRLPWGYDPKRILLGDLDGDGVADLVYIDTDLIRVWFNQSGNGWSMQPLEIPGIPSVAEGDALRIVDLHGSGVAGILWSAGPHNPARQRMSYLDLAGGIKPYLLNQMSNNLGATTRVQYASSTKYFLDDNKCETTRWRTPLPFPVQVVARVEVIDDLSKGKLTTEYRYHNGYWDGVEREFRGFGKVEQYDSEGFTDYHNAGLHESESMFQQVPTRYFSPPTLTKSWFHQGPVGDEYGTWAEQDYSGEYWDGDPQMLNHKSSVDDFLDGYCTAVYPHARRDMRDALRSLRGSVLRTELYALDGSDREDSPYTVTEHAYELREVSPPTAAEPDRRRIFFPHAVAQRTTQWERGDDPLTVYSFTADYDAFGQPRQQTRVAMPRRSARRRTVTGAVIGGIQPDETRILATHVLTDRAQPDQATVGVPDGHYIHDRVWQVHGFEAVTAPTLTETNPSVVEQVLRDQYILARRLHDTYVAGLIAWTPGAGPPAFLTLNLHTVNHYDGTGFGGRTDGKVVYGALTRTESLVFTDTMLNNTYADGAGTRRPTYLDGTSGLPAGAPADFGTAIGYQHRTAAPYQDGWYMDTMRQQFDFQTSGNAPPGWGTWPSRGAVVAMQDAIGHQTTIARDRYWLLPVSITDAVGLQVAAKYSLRVMQPEAISDPNGNTTQTRFTPHGLPAKRWLESKEDVNHHIEGGSESEPDLSWTYDLLAYQKSSTSLDPQPPSVCTTQRIWHASDGISDETIQVVEYSDGFGRVIQKRTQAADRTFGGLAGDDVGLPASAEALPAVAQDSVATDRVIVSSWQIHNNKGNVVEKYEPFFSNGSAYQPQKDAKRGQHIEFYYDPRGQMIRTLNADGSQLRAIYGRPKNEMSLAIQVDDMDPVPASFDPSPWEIYTYDANDLAPISVDEHGVSLSARAPANHHFTPTSAWIDALGRTICQVRRNGAMPGGDWYISRSTYDIRGNLVSVIDPMGRIALRQMHDCSSRSLRIESIDAGLRTAVINAMGSLVEHRDSKGAITLHVYDNLNRLAQVWARNDATGLRCTLREHIVYGDGDTSTQSAAERDTARRINALGQPVGHWDEAGVQRFVAYDFKGNLLAKTRQVVSDATLSAVPSAQGWIADWSQPNANAVLDAVAYRTDTEFDALHRPVKITLPKDVLSHRRVFRLGYNRAGALATVKLYGSVGAPGEDYIKTISYNARRQRVLIEYGNGLMTRYAYDQRTFRLARMRTERIATPRVSGQWRGQGSALQDCTYAYDLAGNITSIDERAPGCGVDNSANGRDRLVRAFEYDAIGRLISATGRACAGRSSALADLPNCGSFDTPYTAGAPAPNQDNAPMLTEEYAETFIYDPNGNVLELDHDTLSAAGRTRLWVRRFGMGGLIASQWQNASNNRLTSLTVNGSTSAYIFDGSGNLQQQNLDTFHGWDHLDRMVSYRVQSGMSPSVEARYLYDPDGMRVKKWVRKAATEESTVYVDRFFEHHHSPDIQTSGQNNTLHVMDNDSRVALVRIGEPHRKDAGPAVTYYLGDHLGSSAVAVGDSGAWINREEFFPYGETSFGSYARKRYRHVGMERDKENGLQYHGARYFAGWLCRWISCDRSQWSFKTMGPPKGRSKADIVKDVDCDKKIGLYGYVRNNPILYLDPDGNDDAEADDKPKLYVIDEQGRIERSAKPKQTVKKIKEDPNASVKPEYESHIEKDKVEQLLEKADRGDVVVIIAHGGEDFFKSNFSWDPDFEMTGSEIREALIKDGNPPTIVIFGMCTSVELAGQAVAGGAKVGIGISGSPQPARVGEASAVLMDELAKGKTVQEAIDAANLVMARGSGSPAENLAKQKQAGEQTEGTQGVEKMGAQFEFVGDEKYKSMTLEQINSE